MTTTINVSENENSDIYNKFEVFGRYQTLQYFLICLTVVMTSMSHINYIFVAENVRHRCRVPECENGLPTVDTPAWWPGNMESTCLKPVLNTEKYNLANQACSNSTFLDVLEECQDWIYENKNTVVAELNIACQPWKITLIGAIHNVGMLVAMIFSGWLSDTYIIKEFRENTLKDDKLNFVETVQGFSLGIPHAKKDIKKPVITTDKKSVLIGRKPTTIVCSVGASIGVIKIFLQNYNAYLVVEFLESLMGSGIYTVGVVLLIEVGGRSKRVLAGVIFAYAIYVGEVLFALLVIGLGYWKWLILAVNSPMILFGLYVFVLRESTRWQILRGKMDSVKKTLITIAKMNKIDISEKNLTGLSDQKLRLKFNVEEQIQKDGLKEIFESKEIMTRVVVTSFCLFTSSFLYYGTIVHSVLLPGNKNINFILSALSSFPGDIIVYFMMNWFGRRITIQCGYLISAVLLVSQSFVPESLSWLKLVLFLGARLGVVMSFGGISTYSLELFPTSVRGSLFGIGYTVARLGSILAPLTPLLITQSAALPSIVFALCAVIASVLIFFTPETKSLPMFDTIAQVEASRNTYNTKL